MPESPVGTWVPGRGFVSPIDEFADKYGVPRGIARRLLSVESSGRPKARSEEGAMGLLQLMPETARIMGVKDPYNPRQNMDAGMRFLRDQFNTFGTWDLALGAYHSGPNAVRRAGNRIPTPSRDYVSKIQGTGDYSVTTRQAEAQARLKRGEDPAAVHKWFTGQPDKAPSTPSGVGPATPFQLRDMGLLGAAGIPAYYYVTKGIEASRELLPEILPAPSRASVQDVAAGGSKFIISPIHGPNLMSMLDPEQYSGIHVGGASSPLEERLHGVQDLLSAIPRQEGTLSLTPEARLAIEFGAKRPIYTANVTDAERQHVINTFASYIRNDPNPARSWFDKMGAKGITLKEIPSLGLGTSYQSSFENAKVWAKEIFDLSVREPDAAYKAWTDLGAHPMLEGMRDIKITPAHLEAARGEWESPNLYQRFGPPDVRKLRGKKPQEIFESLMTRAETEIRPALPAPRTPLPSPMGIGAGGFGLGGGGGLGGAGERGIMDLILAGLQ